MRTETIRLVNVARESNGEIPPGLQKADISSPLPGNSRSAHPSLLSRQVALDHLINVYHTYADCSEQGGPDNGKGPAENAGKKTSYAKQRSGITMSNIKHQGEILKRVDSYIKPVFSGKQNSGNKSTPSPRLPLPHSQMPISDKSLLTSLYGKLNLQIQDRDFILSTKHYSEGHKDCPASAKGVKKKVMSPGSNRSSNAKIEVRGKLIKTEVAERLVQDSTQQVAAKKTALAAHTRTAVRNAATAIESVIRKSLSDEWPDDDIAARLIYLLIKASNTFTFEHSSRVIDLSVDLAREMGINDEQQLKSIEDGARFHDIGEVELDLQNAPQDVKDRLSWYIGISDIKRCGFLHDIGKVKIPESILYKPGTLTDEEFEIIKMHPVIGEEILKPIPSLQAVLPVVRHHHEKWDGRGYPDGIAGDDIPIEARIVCITDAYDAMVSDRPYRKGMSVEKARQELQKCAGSHFDPLIVKAFLKVLKEKEAREARQNH